MQNTEHAVSDKKYIQKEPNGSAGLLDELDQQERKLRTMLGGSTFL